MLIIYAAATVRSNFKHLWLWVPAFAGTTTERITPPDPPPPHPARENLLASPADGHRHRRQSRPLHAATRSGADRAGGLTKPDSGWDRCPRPVAAPSTEIRRRAPRC